MPLTFASAHGPYRWQNCGALSGLWHLNYAHERLPLPTARDRFTAPRTYLRFAHRSSARVQLHLQLAVSVQLLPAGALPLPALAAHSLTLPR